MRLQLLRPSLNTELMARQQSVHCVDRDKNSEGLVASASWGGTEILLVSLVEDALT